MRTSRDARFAHGLVIGKFYPPHAGHHLLIETAAAACRRLSVVVMAATCESIPLTYRVQWLREAHPSVVSETECLICVIGVTDDLIVDYDSEKAWEGHVALMRAAIERSVSMSGDDASAAVVDLVATSEPYGAELAQRLGATHLLVDPNRSTQPVSGTAVRADVARQWQHLRGPVRAGLARRVVVLGAESTGTTTVSSLLAEALRARGGCWENTGWVPEFGREFTIRKLAAASAMAAASGSATPGMDDLIWTSEDFTAIAARQQQLENAAAATGSPVLVCDTDAFATSIWHQRYLGTPMAAGHPTPTRSLGRADGGPGADLYLLTDDEEVPFVQDGIRDGEHLRSWMTRTFVQELNASGRRWVHLRGSLDERVAEAVRQVDVLLAEGWPLADPPG
ncbi:MAG TPA: AAA family ATPase [Kineosporiaceae bacterium]|nr:AAA family ATPase [Kineosporiaceae bacterium]